MTDVTASAERALVTFAVFAYNQEKYVREAIEGAFAQTYEPLEIILSDDCSTDRTFEIIKEMVAQYSGRHTVRVRKSVKNLGIAMHFNELMCEAGGNIVVLAAGDDISHPLRTTCSVQAFSECPELSFVEVEYANFRDGNGLPRLDSQSAHDGAAISSIFDLNLHLSRKAPDLCGAARAIKLEKLKIFGPLSDGCPTEDSPSKLRLLMNGKGAKVKLNGLARRLHDKNLSGGSSIAKMKFNELKRQYFRDIGIASELGLLTNEIAEACTLWAEKTIERRRLKVMTKDSRIGLFRFVAELLKVDALTYKEKLPLVKGKIVARFFN